MLFVSVVFFAHLTGLHCQGFNLVTNQETGAFVKANHRMIWVIGQSVEAQNLLHMSQKATIHLPNAPGAFEMRL
jgi:hypothetical protein